MENVIKSMAAFPPPAAGVTWEIPVRVTICQKSDGTSVYGSVSEAYINGFLSDMNAKLAGGPNTFHLFSCGPINYINSDQLYSGSLPLSEFSYVCGFLNLYLYYNPTARSFATFPWHPEPGKAYLAYGTVDIYNKNGFHELGHTLGLRHTFDPSLNYVVPVQPDQVDNPNKQGIVDPANILAKNLMSYTGACRQDFTLGQISLADQNMTIFLDPYYREELCGNLIDRVEIAGSATGLDRVALRITPTTSLPDQVRTVVNTNGDFSGKLPSNAFSTQVGANLKRFGKTDIATYDDAWVGGLSAVDLICMRKYILGLGTLDGYQLLASDANQSNTLTTFDLSLFSKLILGVDTKLAAYDQPWRFIPEVVTQLASGGLHPDFDGLLTPINNASDNPFAVAIGGQVVSASQYCSPDWPFFMIAGSTRNGFDAVKLGNVCGPTYSGLSEGDCPGEVALLVPHLSVPAGKNVYLGIQAFNFQSVAAFQLELRASAEDFEYVGATSSSLAGFSAENSIGGLNLGQDNLKVLWLNETLASTSLADGSVIFSLQLKAKRPIADLSESITLDEKEGLETYFLAPDGGCKSTTSLEIAAKVEAVGGGVGDRDLGTQSLSAAPAKLHCIPNPASDQATLLFDTDRPFTGNIFIYELQGRFVKTIPYSFEAGRNVIALSDFVQLPLGVLNIAIFDGQETHTVRVVKN